MVELTHSISMKKLLIILFLGISIIASPARWYISPTGNDTSGNGSISTPYFTLSKAWGDVAAGDTIYVRGGTYNYTATNTLSNKSGGVGNLISILNYPGESPVFNYGNGAPYTTQRIGFSITNVAYLRIRGIRVTNIPQPTAGTIAMYGMLLWNYVTNSSFEQMEFDHIGGWGVTIGDNSSNLLFLNCDSHHNQDPYSSVAYGWSDGFQTGSTTSTNITFDGCRAWSNSDDGWDLRNANGVYTLRNCQAFRNGFIPGSWTTAGNGVGFKMGGKTAPSTTDTLRFLYNCLAFDNRVIGFNLGAAGADRCLGAIFYNCSSYRNNQGYNVNQYTNNAVIKNSWSFSDTGGAYYGNAYTIHTNNSFDVPITVTSDDFISIDTTGVSGSRQSGGEFPDLNLFRLVGNSDLIDAGTNVGLPYRGSAPDLGTFEREMSYYVKIGGNDLLDGRSDATAWATLARVNASTFYPGDSIFFRRGDTFRGFLLAPSNGSSGNHIVFDAYGSGAKPKILGSKDISATSDWESHSGNVWKTTATAGAYSAYVTANDIGNLIFNNEAFCGVKVSALVNVDTQGDFFFNTADSLIYIYSTSNPGTFYSHIECGGNYAESVVKAGSGKSYIQFRNLDVRYAGNPGIFIDRANNIIVEYCDISWIGGWWAYSNVRQGNGIQMWLEGSSTHNITVRYNKVDQCYDAGISPQGTNAHVATNILMYYNIVTNCHYSYETWLSATHTQNNVHFLNNTCLNSGYSWSANQRPDLDNDSHVMIWTSSGTATNCTIKNNIFFRSRERGMLIGFVSPLPFILDNNLFFDIDTIAENNLTSAYHLTLSAWQTASTRDASSLYSNPLFRSPIDYHLQAGSPAIDAGTDVGLSEDYDGNVVPFNSIPDIGAYEYGSYEVTTGTTLGTGTGSNMLVDKNGRVIIIQ